MADDSAVNLSGKIAIDTRSLTAAQKKLDKLNKALKQTEEDSNQDIKVNVDSTGITETNNQLKQTNVQLKQAQSNARTLGQTLKGGIGNAAFQVQDIAVQLQAGTNKAIIAAQQLPQLLGGFGPTGAVIGAVVGVGAAIGGALLPSLLDSKDATEELNKSLEKSKGLFDDNGDSANTYSEELAKSAEKSRELAQSKILTGLKAVGDGLDQVSNKAKELVTNSEGLFSSFASADIEQLNQYLQQTGQSIDDVSERLIKGNTGLGYAIGLVSDLKDELGLTANQALSVASQFQKIADGGATQEKIKGLADELTRITEIQGGGASDSLVQLQAALQDLSDESLTLQERQDSLQRALKLTSDELQGQSKAGKDLDDKYQKLIQSLDLQAKTAGKARSEVLELTKAETLEKAAKDGQTQAVRDHIAADYDLLIAQAKVSESTKANAVTARNASKALSDSLKQQKTELQESLAFQDTSDPFAKAQASLQKNLATLKSYKTLSDEQYSAKRSNIFSDYNQQLEKIQSTLANQQFADRIEFGDPFDKLAAQYEQSLERLQQSTLPEETIDIIAEKMKNEYLLKRDELKRQTDAASFDLFGESFDTKKTTEALNQTGAAFSRAQSVFSSMGNDTAALIAKKGRETAQLAKIGIDFAKAQILNDPKIPWYAKTALAVAQGIQFAALFSDLIGIGGGGGSTSSTGDQYDYSSNEAPSDANQSGIAGKSSNGQPIYVNMTTSVDPITGESISTVMTNDQNVVNSQVTNMSKNKSTFNAALG